MGYESAKFLKDQFKAAKHPDRTMHYPYAAVSLKSPGGLLAEGFAIRPISPSACLDSFQASFEQTSFNILFKVPLSQLDAKASRYSRAASTPPPQLDDLTGDEGDWRYTQGLCSSCGSTKAKLMQCSRCKLHAHCSTTCQRSAWKARKHLCRSASG